MARFRIYHQAPGGPKMYHCDSGATLSSNPKKAKVYGRNLDKVSKEVAQKQIEICRNNFVFAFNEAGTGESGAPKIEYRTGNHWRGSSLEHIKTFYEVI